MGNRAWITDARSHDTADIDRPRSSGGGVAAPLRPGVDPANFCHCPRREIDARATETPGA